MHRVSLLFGGFGLLRLSLASNYQLVDDYSGSNFFDKMSFFTGGDPTHGYVNYVDRGTAQNQGLINTNNGVVYMGVDHNNVASGSGRSAVRVSSTKSYTHMLVVVNLGNMPGGCGVWPAFWTLGPNWPNGGEIDIIEGVNDQRNNYMTLHSSAGCAVSNAGGGILQPYSQDCNVAVNGNEGCSFHEPDTVSYGSGMNSNGGAQYAMEWTSAGVKIWWWNRRNPPPSDMFGSNPNPANWGRPSANWAGSGCNWDGHFANHQLVFDTTFCGDWAGAVWSSSSCASLAPSCQAFVQNNPGAFAPAYWSILSLKVYQNNGANNNIAESHNSTLAGRDAEGELVPAPVEVEKRAYASQVAPSLVPKASQTVNPARASQEAQTHPGTAGKPPAKKERHVKRFAA